MSGGINMGFVSDVILSLGRGDGFPRDWYGYLTNQVSHVGLGIFAAWAACLVAFVISSDLPYRWQVFAGISAVYAAKELIIDRWQGADTVEDFLFVVVYGAGGTLASFRQIDDFSSDVAFNIYSTVPFLVACGLHLAGGSFIRWKAAHNE